MANGGWQDYTKVWLVLPDGARVYYPRISPGIGWTDAVFENSDAPTAYYKSRITYRAWGWDLTFQDGTIYRFGDNAPLQWMRDRYGNLTRILRTGTDAYGNGTGQITRVISPNGRWIAFTYGAGNRVSQAMDNLGRTVGYTYDGSGRLTKVTDPAGGETEYTYDA
ncbi:MAG: RHS repeat protein, partial [Propionibacteriaceae bacterium]|nr:RHS repeat protein [Propionibacteriaceae bacterium]